MGNIAISVARAVRLKFLRRSEPVYLSVCAIFRNEAPYLDEWIRFHSQNGVAKFFLINHKSEDNYAEVLEPWVANGSVILIQASTDDQVIEYNEVLKKFGSRTKWLAFIDIDEFLFSPTGDTLPGRLALYPDVAAVFVYWRLFGSSGNLFPPQGGVIENYLQCLQPPTSISEAQEQTALHQSLRSNSKLTGAPIQGKCIIRTEKVKGIEVHWPVEMDGKVSDERGRTSEAYFMEAGVMRHLPSSNVFRINHYWSRSISELKLKSERPPVHRGLRYDPELDVLPGERSLEWERFLNASFDTGALENYREAKPLVFLIGFNKTGTKTYHNFFTQHGFAAIHWDRNRLAQSMQKNLAQGKRLLLDYEHFQVFSDFTLISDSEYLEGNFMFRELYANYPSGYFILNTRRTQEWVESRLRHNGGLFARRHKEIRGLGDDRELGQIWAVEKEEHETAVRNFFHGHHRFLELDISDKGIPDKLADFMSIEFSYQHWSVATRLIG